jgi:hypothetical protein
MRRMKIVSIAALAALIMMLPQAASAFGWHRHHHSGSDPYAYRYEPRGYYPYYKSHYWRPAHRVRRRYGIRAPRYFPAWGYHKRHWRHRQWHARHHGRHHFWHW